MSAIPLITDGDYTTRLLLAPTKITRPFLNHPTKDSTTKLFERWYEIDRGSYTPFAALATLPADGTADPADAAAYILDESEPDLEPDGTQRVRCLFGHVPPAQTLVTSIKLTKPALEGTFPQAYGEFRIFQPDTTLLRYDAYEAQTVTSDTGAPGFYPTGGTYTITFAGYTTGALNYNDAAATVQTALNALTSVSNRGNVVVSGSYNSAGGLIITFNDYAQITINTGSLTGGTIVSAVSKTNNGYSQSVSANLQASVTAISANITGLTATGAFFTQDNYADGTNPPVTGMSRFGIMPDGGAFSITGGTYTLTIAGVTTAAINYNADLVDIQAALDLVAPGLYRVGPWPAPQDGGGGFEDYGYTNRIVIAVYFLGGAPTGGTFTLTVGADTTAAIAYNATAAAVETALELLTTVTNRGGCSVSGTLSGGFAITFANAAMTSSSTSLTPTGSLATPSITDGAVGRTHKIVFTNPTSTRDLYISGHGISEGEAIYIKLASGATYYAGITNYSVPDANTIRLNLSSSDAYATATTISECGRRTKQSYTPGVATVPAKRITNFYLPGVTSGITTDDDIPIPYNQSDGVNFLEAVFSGIGTLNWEVGDLDIYHGPIRSLTKTTINVVDI